MTITAPVAALFKPFPRSRRVPAPDAPPPPGETWDAPAGAQWLEHIEALFDRHGDQPYEGLRREAVSALAHALQCADLAQNAGAPPSLVAAALLHDLGHFGIDVPESIDDGHEHRAARWLARAFGPAVTEPIRLHVAAKRYLVAVDARYAADLSPASRHSLSLQGGPMSVAERTAFDAQPHAESALRLRRWDDAAKRPGAAAPALATYLPMLRDLLLAGQPTRPTEPARCR